MVEYALVMALLLVPAIATVTWLNTQTAKETNSQADCVSKRPPPASCQARAITTTTSTTAPPPTTTTTLAGPTTTTTTTTPPPTTAAPAGSVAWNAGASTYNGATRRITLRVDLTASPGATPLAGATATFRMTITPSGQSFATTCTSQANGTCTGSFDVPVGVTSVTGELLRVDSNPATVTMPANVLTWSTP